MCDTKRSGVFAAAERRRRGRTGIWNLNPAASGEPGGAGVVSDQIGFQKWKPEMETRAKDLTETLKDVQMKVDQVALNISVIQSAGGVQIEKGMPASAHLEASASGKAPGPNRYHFAAIHRPVTENLRTPAPVEGTQQPVSVLTVHP